MGFPVNINPDTPANTDSPEQGDDQFRALKLAILDLFGLPSTTNITVALMVGSATGIDELILKDGAANASAVGRIRRNGASLTFHDGTASRVVVLGNVDLGQLDILGLDEIGLTDATVDASAIGRFRRNGTALTYHDGLGARRVVVTVTDLGEALIFNAKILAAASGATPDANTLYRESVVKGWGQIDSAGALVVGHNISATAKLGTGSYRVTWARDFSSANYVAIVGGIDTGAATITAGVVSTATTHTDVQTRNNDVAANAPFYIMAIGAQ